jgi:hypothetical protein
MTAITYPFAPASDAALFSDMPGNAFKIHCYALKRQGIPGWKIRTTDICKTLHLTRYAVKAALKWLQKNGYATFKRAYGFTRWTFSATPTAPAITEQVEIRPVEQVEIQPVLERKRYIEKKKPLPEPIPEQPVQEPVVVVDDVALTFPEQLNPVQKKAAKAIIKKVKQPELQQPVLFALAYAITNGKIASSIPGYLQALVKRANDGTFEPVGAATVPDRGGKPIIPVWQGFADSTPSKPDTAKAFIKNLRQSLSLYPQNQQDTLHFSNRENLTKQS